MTKTDFLNLLVVCVVPVILLFGLVMIFAEPLEATLQTIRLYLDWTY